MIPIATRTRWLLLSLLVLSVASPAVGAQPSSADSLRARKLAARRYAGGAVSLPVSAFASGLRTCSRETPSGVAGYWKVPPKIVDLIDVELLKHVRKSGIDQRLPFSAKLYIRQYAGFVRDGVRHVYVNALLVEKNSPLASQAQKGFPDSCAGISGSWGIEYDTQAKKFVGFSAK
jgi:hypothetical protein